MEAINVRFYTNTLELFKTMVIDASSLEDFNKKLENLTILVNTQAEEKGVMLRGYKYDLPEGWE